MAVTITIPFPEARRAHDPGPGEQARRPDAVRSALVSLGWAVAIEVVEDLVPGLGVAVALVRVARVACAVGPDDRPEPGQENHDDGGRPDAAAAPTKERAA